LSYATIGKRLGLSVNTVKSFCRRRTSDKLLCRNCGKALEQTPKQKAKSFCGDWCRRAWWKTHRDQIRKKALYRLRCLACGRHFESYGNRNRKYCSHDCYIADRFKRSDGR
jgi:rRNA maturation endonuclease Nob1